MKVRLCRRDVLVEVEDVVGVVLPFDLLQPAIGVIASTVAATVKALRSRDSALSKSFRKRLVDPPTATPGHETPSRRWSNIHSIPCRRGDLNSYSPPPRGFIVGPELWLRAA